MTDERWRRQWDIFHEALERAPDERDDYLLTACGEDRDLLEAIRKLLAAHDDNGGFLEEPLIVTTNILDELEPEAMLGEDIGSYVIRRVIGEGGMGVVYEAEQTAPVRRRVALKIIKLGMNTRDVVARFEQERQALAVMNHANVAKVYDAGVTRDGRPYFVMEYVDGSPITAYCDQRRLSNRERLELCRQVFAGIQHAHQKGLIHRDIKPSNLLVEQQADEPPVVKIIDFGIAKATDQHAAERTIFTQLGRLVGTPAYMSPEQAEVSGADVDTRSDIYSLSVLLYELLTGAVPFENETLLSAGYAEMQRIIREDDPPAPSLRLGTGDRATVTRIAELRHTDFAAIRRELAGDLDWIIMKGLEKQPARRYDSVAALAADIERHLHDEPVVARPPGTMYRLGKFVRRHTLGVNLAVLSVVVLVAFMVSTIMQSRELARALGSAETAQARAEQVSSFLIELLTESDPNVSQGESLTVREALDRGADKIAAELDDQPATKLAILVQMGSIYRQLGYYDKAQEILDRARELAESGTDIDTASLAEFGLASGNLSHDQGNYDATETSYLDALARLRELGEDSRDYAVLLNDLGDLYVDMGRYGTAEEYYTDSLAMSRRLNAGDHDDTANALVGLAYDYMMAGNLEAAGPLFAEATAMNRRLHGERSNQVATSLNYLAVYDRRSGNYDAAIAALEESLSIYTEVLGPDHPFTATNLSNLANAFLSAGRLEEAEEFAHRAIAVFEAQFDEPHPNLATAYYVLASIQSQRGDYAGAEQAFRRTLDVDLSLLDDTHPRVFMDKEQLAVTLKHQGRLDEAEALQREVLEGRQATLGDKHVSVANAHVNLSSILALAGQLDEAETHARRAIAILAPVEPETPRMIGSRMQLASVLYEQDRFEASNSIYEEILELQRQKLAPDHPDIAKTLYGIGLNRLALDVPAEDVLEEALKIRERVYGPDNEQTRLTRQALELARQQ